MTTPTETSIALAEQRTTHNYHPLPVVVSSASGSWVTDVEGRRYLDCLAGYSALNFGHSNPELLAAAHAQLDRVTLTSRAFHHDQLGPFCADLADLAGMDLVLPMNSGAEAVESAIKVSRKWGYQVKGVPDGQATIVVADGNFHGRTTTIISFSTDPEARADFGPYTPGFRIVPYGDADALARRDRRDHRRRSAGAHPGRGRACSCRRSATCPALRVLCTERNVLLVADEIQSGLGRTATRSPASRRASSRTCSCWARRSAAGSCRSRAVVGRGDVLGVLKPGEHGSHVRRQPAGLRRRPGGRPAARARASSSSGPASSATCCTPARRAGRPRPARGPGTRPVGRRRRRPGAGHRS